MKATLESIFEDMNELEKIMRKIGDEPKRINVLKRITDGLQVIY